MDGFGFFNLFGGLILLILILASAIHIVKEYERLVIFRLGRLIGVKGPGLILIIPIIDRVTRVSLRIVVYDVPTQEVITRDNVTCSVNAVLYYRVVDPSKSVVNVQEFHQATTQLAQTTLRSVVGQAELDELLSERDKLNQTLQKIMDESTDPWGIKVTAVEIKDVVIPSNMQRAIARQAEAERTRRAIVIQSEGEKEAALRLSQAAAILSENPGAMSLRALRTAVDVSAEKGNTLFFPLPMEFGKILTDLSSVISGEPSLNFDDSKKEDENYKDEEGPGEE